MSQSESEDEEDESIFDKNLFEDIPINLQVQPPEQRMIGNTVALAGTSQDAEVKKDAVFSNAVMTL